MMCFIDLCVLLQIFLCEKKVTTIKTRVMRMQKPLPSSHQPPQKTSKAKTPQVHCVLNMCSGIITSLYTNMPPIQCTGQFHFQ